jgi:hypothetical protein
MLRQAQHDKEQEASQLVNRLIRKVLYGHLKKFTPVQADVGSIV